MTLRVGFLCVIVFPTFNVAFTGCDTMTDFYYDAKGDLCAYGTFRCARCGERFPITHDDFKERASEGRIQTVIGSDGEKHHYPICNDCLDDLASDALNGIVPDLSSFKEAVPQSYEERMTADRDRQESAVRILAEFGIPEDVVRKWQSASHDDAGSVVTLISLIPEIIMVGMMFSASRKKKV